MASIYDRIGGTDSVNAAVDLFYAKLLNDPKVSGYFAGVDMARLKGHQRAFITAALGGPQGYTGRDMGPAHAGLGVTGAAFDTVVGHLADTLAQLGVDAGTIGEIAAALAPLRAQIVTEAAPQAS